jgi:predicted ester cyclase
MGVQEHKDAIERAIELWNAHDERYFEIYTEDVVAHGFPPDVPPNIEGIRGMFGQMWAAFPDIRGDLEQVVAEGDAAAVRFLISGTHEGEFMGVAPTGKRIELEVMAMLRFDDEAKIAERWTRMDEVALLTQLGLMPSATEVPA